MNTFIKSSLLLFSFTVLVAFQPPAPEGRDLKEEAFQILDTKCNVCHRRQNPFKIFSLKNMDKNAQKINKQVFIKGRMPKGDEIKLTEEEYATLKAWIQSQKTS